MLCKSPISVKGVRFGCGQCLPCRLNKRREWTLRIMMEAKKHEKNTFLTLTYNNENLPSDGSLVPSDTQKFLKRLRKSFTGQTIRYYLVGEYGDRSQRPHYHAAIFGLGAEAADMYERIWGKGYTDAGTLTFESAQYIAGYVTKKLTVPDNDSNKDFRSNTGQLLNGRYPEFARMSLKPGIGAGAADAIAELYSSEYGRRLLQNFADAPPVLHVGGKTWPVSKYIRDKVREKIGWQKNMAGWKFPEEVQNTKKAKAILQSLQQTEKISELSKKLADPYYYLDQQRKQKSLNAETKHQIYNQRKI